MIEIKVKGVLPKKAHTDDAAFDLEANIDGEICLWPDDRVCISTGVFIELPVGYEAQIRPRSGLALKHGITVLNSPGTIDAGFRGEIGVILHNTDPDEKFIIKKGDRIAQMVIQKLPEVVLVPTESLSDSERGGSGFGSTG